MKHQEAFCIMRQEIKNNTVYFACMAFPYFLKQPSGQWENIALQQTF